MKLTPEQIKITNVIQSNMRLIKDLKMQNDTLMTMLPDGPARPKKMRLFDPATGRMERLGRGKTGGPR